MRRDFNQTVAVRVFTGTYRTNDLQARCFLFGGELTHLPGHPGVRQSAKQLQKQHAEYETTDMRPPGNAACGSVTAGGIEKLQEKPQAQKNKCRNIDKIRDKKNRDERKNF